jgi:catechol 2,3-dioxygenase-like lactoylglutathione lyase family enzyme
MPARLDHTIVGVRDREESAGFLAHVLGLDVGRPLEPFLPVVLDNGVSLDFMTVPPDAVTPQHFAFRVEEGEFDGILARFRALGGDFWADPHQAQPGEINHDWGGRGFYFLEPSGHWLEVLTQPYGSPH